MSEAATLDAPTTEGDSMEVQLKVSDRCDRCGAQAFMRICYEKLKGDSGHLELLFCGHHGKEQEEAIKEKSAQTGNIVKIYDYTASINIAPSISASVNN